MTPRQSDERDGEQDAAEHLEDTEEWEEVDPDVESEFEVTCPHCGEAMSITIDAGGGAAQEYVEDCQVCCRPWQVHVRFGSGGATEVWVEASG